MRVLGGGSDRLSRVCPADKKVQSPYQYYSHDQSHHINGRNGHPENLGALLGKSSGDRLGVATETEDQSVLGDDG